VSITNGAEHLCSICGEDDHVCNHQHVTDGSYEALVFRAMMLAPTVTICEALLRGEEVPVSQLDPVWARRYGLL
jgi:hypothetical protein